MKTHLSTGIIFTLVIVYLLICSIGATVVNSEPLFLLLMVPCIVALYYLYKFRFRVPINFVVILELAYGGILWFSFDFYMRNKDYDYNFDHYIASCLFAILLLIILMAEWLRRKQNNSDRAKYEKYLYLPVMFFALIFAMFYVNSLLGS